MKFYAGAKTLTREMALQLIEYINVDVHLGKHNLPRTIEIFYKLIDCNPPTKRTTIYD